MEEPMPPYAILHKRPGKTDVEVARGIYSATIARNVRNRLAKSGEYVASDLVIAWVDAEGNEHYL